MALDPETSRAIDDIVQELRELTMVMRSLGRTMSAIGDDEIKAFAKETDGAAGSVKGLGKNAQGTGKLLDQFGREIQSSTEATESATEATKKDTEATEESARSKRQLTREEFVYRRAQRSAFRDLAEEFSSTRGATARLQEGFLGSMRGNEALQAAVLLTESLFRGLGKATVSLTRDIYAGQRGAAVTARAFTQLAKEVGSAAQGVGLALGAFSLLGIFVPQLKLFGIALGAVRTGFAALAGLLALFGVTLKATAELNEIAAQQNDALFKSFNELSRAGASAVGGMDGLFETLQRAGMSVAEIESFTAQVAANTQRLALLGATTGEATRRFAAVAGELRKSPLGRELEMLGIQAEEQRDSVMSYMTMQARLGRLENRNTQDLIQSSARYAKELDLLAQLTGTSRKEQQEIRDRQMAEERYRSAIVAARNRGDQAELARLERAGQLAAAVEAAGDRAGALGILQIAAGRGALTTPEAVAAEMTYGVNAVLNSQGSVTDALRQLVDQGRISQAGLADINALIGTISGIQTPVADLANVIDRTADAFRRAEELGISVQELLQRDQAQREQGDRALQQNVDAARLQQNAAQLMDSVVRTFNPAATVMETASRVFESAVQKFAETVGARPVAGGLATVGGVTPGQTSMGPDTGAVGYVPYGSGAKSGDGSDIGAQAFPQGAPHQRTARALREAFVDPVMSAGSAVAGFFRGMQDPKYRTESAQPPLDPDHVLAFQGRISGHRENFDRLDPEFRDRLLSMAQAYTREMGHAMPFHSGYRSREQNQSVGGTPDSLHLQGRAADLGLETVAALDKLGLLDQFGFKKGRSGSHVSDTGKKMGGISRGPDSGYLELLHGTEAVVPLPDGKSIPVSLGGPIDRLKSMLGNIDTPQPLPKPIMENNNRITEAATQKQIDMMSAQLSRLDEVVSVMRNQLGVSQRILQVAQN